MNLTPEDAAFEVINQAVENSVDGDVIFGAEVHDSVYQTITQDFGYRVGDCESDIAPLRGGQSMDEFDATLTIVCFARVAGTDKKDRRPARTKARELMLAVAKILHGNSTMNGEVRNSRILRGSRGFDSEDGETYAVAHLPLIVNETGRPIRNEFSLQG